MRVCLAREVIRMQDDVIPSAGEVISMQEDDVIGQRYRYCEVFVVFWQMEQTRNICFESVHYKFFTTITFV